MSRYDERVALVAPTACSAPRGRSSMVELQLPKLTARVRFPSPAPLVRHSGYRDFRPAGKCQGGVFAVLGRFSGCWGRAYWAAERLPAGADRSFGADSQLTPTMWCQFFRNSLMVSISGSSKTSTMERKNCLAHQGPVDFRIVENLKRLPALTPHS